MEGVRRARIARPRRGLGGVDSASDAPQPTAATPACQTASASSGRLLGARLGAQRDDVGQLADGLDVAQLRQPREAQRVEPVARQQREIGLDRPEQARRAVVQQLALADGLDHEGDVGLAAARARPGRGGGAQRAVLGRRGPQGVGQQAALRQQGGVHGGQRHAQNASRKAAAAASTVRSTCSASCASDGNHASYCDGGA